MTKTKSKSEGIDVLKGTARSVTLDNVSDYMAALKLHYAAEDKRTSRTLLTALRVFQVAAKYAGQQDVVTDLPSTTAEYAARLGMSKSWGSMVTRLVLANETYGASPEGNKDQRTLWDMARSGEVSGKRLREHTGSLADLVADPKGTSGVEVESTPDTPGESTHERDESIGAALDAFESAALTLAGRYGEMTDDMRARFVAVLDAAHDTAEESLAALV